MPRFKFGQIYDKLRAFKFTHLSYNFFLGVFKKKPSSKNKLYNQYALIIVKAN